jgi:hypothetical protein
MRQCIWGHRVCRNLTHVGARNSEGRLSQYLILMGLFIASPPIERRHTRQRIAEKPSRQIARLELGSAITIGQRQGTGPKARREHEVSRLAAASSFIQDFGHCSFPPYDLPKPQPYGTPAPWPNGDGRLTGLGPNMGTSMKNRTQFTHRLDT